MLILPHSQDFRDFNVAACIAIHSKMLVGTIRIRRDAESDKSA